jgi:hypothetical protein
MSFVGATRTLIITPQFLKDNSVINDNVEDNILEAVIRIAEDKYIHPKLGSRLVERINTEIATYASGGTITAEYKTLIDDYITACVIQYSIYEYVPYTFKFRNKGISTQTSPDSTPASVSDLGYIRESVKSTAEFYAERLISYLKNNTSLYPEYIQAQSGDITPSNNGYTGSGIFIPNYLVKGYGINCCNGLDGNNTINLNY